MEVSSAMNETTTKRGAFRRLLDRFVGLRGESSASSMASEFAAAFPGRCMICSYHQYGLREGLTSDPMPKPHDCIEKRPNGSIELPAPCY